MRLRLSVLPVFLSAPQVIQLYERIRDESRRRENRVGNLKKPVHAYCIAVFHGDEQFTFNANLPVLAKEELERLRRVSQLSLMPFFPLRYSTAFRRDDGERIAGLFDYDRAA
jgi:hypothetical protein